MPNVAAILYPRQVQPHPETALESLIALEAQTLSALGFCQQGARYTIDSTNITFFFFLLVEAVARMQASRGALCSLSLKRGSNNTYPKWRALRQPYTGCPTSKYCTRCIINCSANQSAFVQHSSNHRSPPKCNLPTSSDCLVEPDLGQPGELRPDGIDRPNIPYHLHQGQRPPHEGIAVLQPPFPGSRRRGRIFGCFGKAGAGEGACRGSHRGKL